MTAPTVPTASTRSEVGAPWLLAHATACAEAVASALDLLDGDDVETLADDLAGGFTLEVHADPLRPVRALCWTPERGWRVTGDATRRTVRRWRPLAIATDADPLELCEALRSTR
jgi:hypothetical protein